MQGSSITKNFGAKASGFKSHLWNLEKIAWASSVSVASSRDINRTYTYADVSFSTFDTVTLLAWHLLFW